MKLGIIDCPLFQSRQPIFVQLLSAAFRVAQCSWLTFEQRTSVENCIQTMSEVAKARGIAVPNDLDLQVSQMFSKAAIISRQMAKWKQKTPGMHREISSNSVSFLMKTFVYMTSLIVYSKVLPGTLGSKLVT